MKCVRLSEGVAEVVLGGIAIRMGIGQQHFNNNKTKYI